MIVVGGLGNNSHISLLRKGVSVKMMTSLDSLPKIKDNGIFIINNRILIAFVGLNYLYPLDLLVENDNININESLEDINSL